jgi:hypothetical protein
MTTYGETLSQVVVGPTKPPTEEHRPQEPIDRDDIDDTLDRRDWWDDADISSLIDLVALCRFLYSCDQLLEDLDSYGDDNKVISHASGTNTKPSPDGQPKLGQSPTMKG